MKGTETWVEIPQDRWPKSWIGKYKRPVCKMRIALYGHPDSGGLWEMHCEKMLYEVGFIMPDPEGWPSVFFHPEMKLLLVVYVDDFKMAGPKSQMAKGWEMIGSRIDMDIPGNVNRYLGCDHVLQDGIRLPVTAHPFAHLFDKSLPDPAAKPAAAANRTQDFWEVVPDKGIYIRHHCQPRKSMYVPDPDIIKECDLSSVRCTVVLQSSSEDDANAQWDLFHDENGAPNQGRKHPSMWVGSTYLFTRQCKDPKRAMASVKRDKNTAKKKARAEGFSYMDQLFENQPCMKKPVNVMTYDMKPFLESCVSRYLTLAKKDVSSLKRVQTPFHEERIARPTLAEEEPRGSLAPIATRVLMKILFAARMARFDLLRAVQGLAARVTKWSADCDKALHRLVSYIHHTLDVKLTAFIGDPIEQCRLWCFADADHAGEYDNRSTTGCFLVLLGPNTYFPLTAFSKKQTSVSISSTESEVVAANISLRSVGLPSSGLWAYLQKAGGEQKNRQSNSRGLPTTNTVTKTERDGDHWEFDVDRRILARVHVKPRTHLYDPKDSDTIPVPIQRIGRFRTTVVNMEGSVDFKQDKWEVKGTYPTVKSWTGKTFFRVYGPYDADYTVEASEVREATTDWEFVGNERHGELMLSLITKQSIKGVFVEDNQATIRILESGRSPAFRRTDKTQRVNLSWLSEQFKRRWYELVHGPTVLQAADILTKPFTNAEKWKLAVSLLSHMLSAQASDSPKGSNGPSSRRPQAAAVEQSSGEPDAGSASDGPMPQRLIIEECSDPASRLSDPSRLSAHGCRVVQFTKKHSLLDAKYREYVVNIVNSFPKTKNVLVWVSLPCTGGTSWSYVNMKIPSAAQKVIAHVVLFKRLWKAMKSFLNAIERDHYIAIEWPKGCRYWKFPFVVRFIEDQGLLMYDFDGCMVGTKDEKGNPIKKPWSIATDCGLVGMELSRFKCDDSHNHVQGRGSSLRHTESYTELMVDTIHHAFQQLSQIKVRPRRSLALPLHSHHVVHRHAKGGCCPL